RERSFDKSFYTLTVRRQNCFWLNVPEWRQWRDFDYQQGAMDGNNVALGSTGYWRQQPARSSWDGSFNNNRNQQYNPIYPNYQPNVAYPSYQQPQYVPPPGRR
uniref:Uncharacterized protein n=1 Tax=Plectus sambesii TaxID=2011161 RepID=A0A914X807_9BILA